jgi:hypothetical protein
MKPIPNYEGYYAAEDGSVYSSKSGKIKKLSFYNSPKHPYYLVSLWVNGKMHTRLLHFLIITAYKGLRPKGMEVRHLDGNCKNNIPSNLSWGTRAENIEDKRKHGSITRGERNGRAKLTQDQVSEIRVLKGVFTKKIISELFDVSESTISWIHRGKTWKQDEQQSL